MTEHRDRQREDAHVSTVSGPHMKDFVGYYDLRYSTVLDCLFMLYFPSYRCIENLTNV